MKTKVFFIILFATMCIKVTAKMSQIEPNEFSIQGRVGLLSLAPISNLFNGYTLDLGVGYTFFFNKNLGFHFGLSPGFYNAKNYEDINVLTFSLIDQNGYPFDLYTTSEYNEIHKTMFLSIPLMLQFQTKSKLSRSWKQSYAQREGLYVMAGIRANIPFNYKFESYHTDITNLAYYPDLDNWSGTQKFAGLGVFEGQELDTNLEIAQFVILAFEAGFKWHLNKNRILYTGLFFDYGLNSIYNNNRPPFNNYIAVNHLTAFPLLVFPTEMNNMAIGISLRLSFFSVYSAAHCAPVKKVKRTI